MCNGGTKPPQRGAGFALEFNPVFLVGGLQGTCHALAFDFSVLFYIHFKYCYFVMIINAPAPGRLVFKLSLFSFGIPHCENLSSSHWTSGYQRLADVVGADFEERSCPIGLNGEARIPSW